MIISGQEYVTTNQAKAMGLTSGQLSYMRKKGLLVPTKSNGDMYWPKRKVEKLAADRAENKNCMLPGTPHKAKEFAPSYTNYERTCAALVRTTPKPKTSSGSLRKSDVRTIMKVLKYVADKSLEETPFGRQMLEDMFPTTATELYIINDYLRQHFGEKQNV